MLGMVGLTLALVWPRDLLTYHGIRRRQGWQGRSTLRPIESICRNFPIRLKLRYTGELLQPLDEYQDTQQSDKGSVMLNVIGV